MATQKPTTSENDASKAATKGAGDPPMRATAQSPSGTSALAPTKRTAPAYTVPRGPFALMHQLFDGIEQMWTGNSDLLAGRGSSSLAFMPPIEVKQKDGELVVKCDLPGLSRDDVAVTVENDALVITGERHSEHEDTEEGIWRCERSYGAFRRVIPLPEGADPESAEARFDHGVLEISLHAPTVEARSRKIEIQAPPAEKLTH